MSGTTETQAADSADIPFVIGHEGPLTEGQRARLLEQGVNVGPFDGAPTIPSGFPGWRNESMSDIRATIGR